MAYDQNNNNMLINNSLRPIHIVRDESRPVNLPNSNPLPRETAPVPVYYPYTAPAGLTYGNNVGLVPSYGYNNNVSGYEPSLVSVSSGEEGGDDLVSGRKVKFLCSYGGKILPRPSDGVLRYVGGDTRIISVRRDVKFNELIQKMFDCYGRNVVIKYQLPDEELDALVTVSRPDDLENMMDEYDKLVERCGDGSAKLRVFLFSDVESCNVIRFKDLEDGGQRYVEAVNGIGDSYRGGAVSRAIGRMGSTASASSTQNSEVSGTEEQGEVIGVGSGGVFSPAGSSATGVTVSKTVSIPASPVQSDHDFEILERTVPVYVQQQQRQFSYDLQPSGATTVQPTAPYVQTYVDPRHGTFTRTEYVQMPQPQMGYQSQIMTSIGPMYAQPQIQDNVVGIGVTPHQFVTPSAHVSFRPNLNANPVPNPVPVPVPVAVTVPAPAPVAVTVPVPAPVAVTVPAPAPVAVTVPAPAPQFVQQQDVRMEHIPERVVHTYRPQSQLQPSHPVITGRYGWNQVPTPEQVPISDSRVPIQQMIYNPEPLPRFDGCIMCQKALPHAHSDTVAQDRKESPGTTISDVNPVYQSLRFDDTRRMMQPMVSTPYNVMVHQVPQCSHESSAQQCGVPMQYQPIQDPVINKLVTGDSTPVGAPSPTLDTPVYDSPREYPGNFPLTVPKEDNMESRLAYDNLRQIDARMEDLRLHPHGIRVEKPRDEILENRPVNLDKSQMVADTNYISSEVPRLHGLQTMESYGMNNDGSPAFSGVTQPVGEWNAYPLQFEPNSEVGTVLVDPLNPFNGVGETKDAANSLFSNQDPWMLGNDSQFPPPRPTQLMTKKEESPTGDSLINDQAYETSANLELNFGAGHCHSDTGSAEELIKQELQAVAEGVAASVLHSLTPSNTDSVKRGSEASRSGEAQNSITDAQTGVEIEDPKTYIPEKANLGFPVSDGLGRLQIIKNSDLEELRELGSGTFGTVYHGKWRGSDVAIKRINDRCFSGKASEQERMREDFWNEAIKLADLHHPNVVAFYGVVLDGPGGSVATVTEYMVNGSLRTALQKNERNLDKRKRLLIAMDVAFGMEYLHGKNIVHFDLKSDNLLVNLRDPHRPICKVGDLGLSKVKRQTLISGGVRGTLPWMAPELLNGSSSLVSEKVDVFSFGIVMWELLTGDEPYADLHYGAIIGGIVSNTLRPPVPESCDLEWRRLMERCWSAEPSERPSFTDIANQLRTITPKVPPKVQAAHQ